MRAAFIHLNGPFRGQSFFLDQGRLVLGSSPDCHPRFPESSGVKERHGEILAHPEGCDFHLHALAGEVFVNQRQVLEVVLEEGDLIELGDGGPKLRFQILAEGESCTPVHVRLDKEGRPAGRTSLLSVLGQFHRRLRLRTKVLVPLGLALVVFGASWLGGWLGGRSSAARPARGPLGSGVRAILERLEARGRHAASLEDLARIRKELARRSRILDGLVRKDRALKSVLNIYSKGVCLIHGTYRWGQRVGGRLKPVSGKNGRPLEVDYVGSGFLVSKRGDVLTNRHMAQPWGHGQEVARFQKQGLEPYFVRFDVCFPDHQPLAVDTATIRLSREGVDLAAFRVVVQDVVVLPLFKGPVGSLRGEHIILLGYPTGLSALIARREPHERQEIFKAGHDVAARIRQLARFKAVSPVITQGALNEVKPRRLVYDADTTFGGSGGPVFALNGQVIGVNFAILKDFGGSNFGVPIRFARSLLSP